jgi:hypothetical protein
MGAGTDYRDRMQSNASDDVSAGAGWPDVPEEEPLGRLYGLDDEWTGWGRPEADLQGEVLAACHAQLEE